MKDFMRIRQEGYDTERIIFDKMRDKIEANLALFGITDFLRSEGYDTDSKRLIVSRNLGYTSQMADIDIDLDPLATSLYVDYEIGIVTETPSVYNPKMRTISGRYLRVAQALIGENIEPSELGSKLEPGQLDIIRLSIESLSTARLAKILPSLNKQLTNLEL